MFYPHAHDQTGDSEKRLHVHVDNSSDESYDMVDVSWSENNTSSYSESEEENLASRKTSCDSGERRKPAKQYAVTTTKTSQPRKKSKVSNFFTVRGLLNRNMTLFAGRSDSKNRFTWERVDSRN